MYSDLPNALYTVWAQPNDSSPNLIYLATSGPSGPAADVGPGTHDASGYTSDDFFTEVYSISSGCSRQVLSQTVTVDFTDATTPQLADTGDEYAAMQISAVAVAVAAMLLISKHRRTKFRALI